MTTRSFEKHKKLGDEHFKTPQEYLAVINDPDYIWVETEARRGGKFHFFGKRSNSENLTTVVVFSRENNIHSIATGYVLIGKKESNTSKDSNYFSRRNRPYIVKNR